MIRKHPVIGAIFPVLENPFMRMTTEKYTAVTSIQVYSNLQLSLEACLLSVDLCTDTLIREVIYLNFFL